MAFGGLFGGSGNDKDKNNNNGETISSSASDVASLDSYVSPSSALGGGSNSSEIRNRVQQAIAQQGNIANAKALISKINENCFDHCVTAPGSSLSGKENACLSACMEKYIDGWNVVSRTYISRLQKEGAQMGGTQGGQSGLF